MAVPANASMSRFEEVVDAQRDLQIRFGFDFPGMDDEQRCAYVRMNVLAMIAELTEALNEVGWKPWATSRHFNDSLFIGELTDVLHFLINLYIVAMPNASARHITDEIVRRFFMKNEVNEIRRSGGYDGVTTKCPACTRALEDITMHEFTIRSQTGSRRIIRTCECGYAIDIVDGRESV